MRKDEKRILKLSIITVLFVEIFLISIFSYIHYRKYHYINKGKVVATVNNINIYERDIEAGLGLFYEENITKIDDLNVDNFKEIVFELYIKDKILELAKNKKLFKNNYYKFISKEYISRLIAEEYLDKYVFGSIRESDIRKRYDELVKITNNKEERKISHILVDTEEEANRIRKNILRLNNFEVIAKKRSKDKISAVNNGCLGYLVKEEITIKEFADVAFLLKLGEISKPIRTKEGWHIIKVDDIRDIKVKSFEESRANIYEELKHKKFEDFLHNVISINGTENIEIFIDLKKDDNYLNNDSLENNENSENKDEENKTEQ